ncbi:hypothetical protein BJV74DRAFT_863315 [Russula compacta]|nr:hypothetical protein BJV74DRAFT_863315 [Russula compacta]
MSLDSSALIAHIVSQTRQNVEFLMAQNEISRDVGQGILAKLPTSNDLAIRELSEQTRRMTIPAPLSPPQIDYDPTPGPPSGPPARRIQPPQPSLQRAKALWTYNENGAEPNDLSFRAGDIIEVVAETNTDWWTGRVNGKQGLFPSNYVEKISPSISPPSYPPPSEARRVSPTPPPVTYQSSPPAPYQPVYNGPPQGGYQPPPPQPYNPYTGPPMQPPPQQVVVQQEPRSQPAKPNRFGGLGQILATSAAGGVGFGAGLYIHECLRIAIPTNIGLVKGLLSAVVLWMLSSESRVLLWCRKGCIVNSLDVHISDIVSDICVVLGGISICMGNMVSVVCFETRTGTISSHVP